MISIPFLLALAVATPAHAERPLTYREVVQTVLENNADLQKASLSVDQSEASLLMARGSFDPTYDLNGSYTAGPQQLFLPGAGLVIYDSQFWNIRNAISGTAMTGTSLSLSHSVAGTSYGGAVEPTFNADFTLSATQQLLKGLSFKYNLENVTVARQGLNASELRLAKARQDALATAADAYWLWSYSVASVEISAESVRVAEEALRIGQLKVAAGELAPVEETRLKAALVQSQSSLLDAESSAKLNANNLLIAMGEDTNQLIQPATPVGNVPEMDLDVDASVEVAMNQNLDLLVAQAALDTSTLQSTNAKHGRLPSLSVGADVGRAVRNASNAGDAAGGVLGAGGEPSWLVRGNFSVPILNRSAMGQAQSAAAGEAQSRVDLEAMRRSVRAQVEQQVLTLSSARRKVELADANQELAAQTLAAEEALSEAGRSIQKDVLEARNELDRSKGEAARARTDYRLAQVKLLQLQGQLSDDLPG